MLRGRDAEKVLMEGIVLPSGDILRLVDWHSFKVDHSYQRGVNQARVNRINKKFDAKYLGIFRVGQRKGTVDLYLVDAQHRHAVLQQREERKQKVPRMVLCLITPNTTQKQEAKMFLGHNNQKTPSLNEKFKAGLTAAYSMERTINDIVEKNGFEIQFVNRRRDEEIGNGLIAVRGLQLAYTQTKQLGNALKFMRTVAGSGNPERVDVSIRNGEVVAAVAKFLEQTPGPSAATIRLFKAMPNFNLVNLWSEARQVSVGWQRIDAAVQRLDAMVGRYNAGYNIVPVLQRNKAA